LEEAGKGGRGATIYVTLEPCSHYGKTPPCADRIVRAGISRVVVACRDPNPLVSGRGIEKLRAAGIEVTEGVLEDEARRVNEIFFKFIRTGIPFVLLKLAQSLDGRIATRTGDSSDDPLLTVRHVEGPNPVRLVLDARGRIPVERRMFSEDGRTIVVTATMPEEKGAELRARGVEVWRIPGAEGKVDLQGLLGRLGKENIDSLLIEGGGETAAAFLEAGLVDKLAFFIAPIIIGGRGSVPAVGGLGPERVADALRLGEVEVRPLGEDLYLTGYPTGRRSAPA